MAKSPLPTQEYLRKLLRYEPDTGKLFWLYRDFDTYDQTRHRARASWNRWNTVHAGNEAFTNTNNRGYKTGSIDSRTLRAHRVIWMLVYGEWPENDIDHINHIRTDNRLSNLRHVTRSENLRNSTMAVTNTSGVTGVTWDKSRDMWLATIRNGGKVINLGHFTKKADAVKSRRRAELDYGYHPNHGSRKAA